MASTVVSGRVDVLDARRAQVYIEQAGKTPNEVIRTVWHNIAETGQLPESLERQREADEALQRLAELRDSLSPAPEWLATMTDDEMKDVLTERLVEKYG